MSAWFNACGVISITTDFGHRGPFVGTMKGVILRRLSDLRRPAGVARGHSRR